MRFGAGGTILGRILLALTVGFGLSAWWSLLPARADTPVPACVWEWGGVPEATPAPCPAPGLFSGAVAPPYAYCNVTTGTGSLGQVDWWRCTYPTSEGSVLFSGQVLLGGDLASTGTDSCPAVDVGGGCLVDGSGLFEYQTPSYDCNPADTAALSVGSSHDPSVRFQTDGSVTRTDVSVLVVVGCGPPLWPSTYFDGSAPPGSGSSGGLTNDQETTLTVGLGLLIFLGSVTTVTLFARGRRS